MRVLALVSGALLAHAAFPARAETSEEASTRGVPPPPAPAPPDEPFAQAEALRTAGRPADAARLLLDAASGDPSESLAPLALLQGGQTSLREAFSLDLAEECLGRLVEGYPDSREARLGWRLLDELREGRASGDGPFVAWLRIRYGSDPPGGTPARIEAMERLVGQALDAPYLPDLYLKLAIELRRDDRHEEAVARLASLRDRWPASPQASQGAWEIGQTYFEQGRLAIARDWFRKVADLPGPGWKEKAAWDVRRVEKHISRRRLLRLAAPLLVLWLAFLVSRTHWPRLTRPVAARAFQEILLLAPFCVMLGIVLTRFSAPIRQSLLLIAAGTVGLVTLSNLHLVSTTQPRWERAIYVPMTLLAFAAMTYSILYAYDLVFLIEDTIRFGPESG